MAYSHAMRHSDVEIKNNAVVLLPRPVNVVTVRHSVEDAAASGAGDPPKNTGRVTNNNTKIVGNGLGFNTRPRSYTYLCKY